MNMNARLKYEEAFCRLVGAEGARAFGLGRQALVILLKALGVDAGDRVGVCSFTCLSVAEAVKVCGAIPVYIDVDEYLCIDTQKILQQNKGALKVIILQHTFGNPGKLDDLLGACKKINALVIEDCAHALGCYWNGRPLGQFGEGAIYSFQWGKPYTTGQGGMLSVNSSDLLDKVDAQIELLASLASIKSELILRCQRTVYSFLRGSKVEGGIRKIYSKLRDKGFIKGLFKIEKTFELYPGYIRRMGEITAKAGLKQLKIWPELKKQRQKNVEIIEDKLCKSGLNLWPRPTSADVVMLRYPVLTAHKTRIIEKARKQNLDIAGWYTSPVHPLHGDDLTKVNYHLGDCHDVESIIEQLVHLPTGLGVNSSKTETMIKIISEN
ncbi:DegT/DnrJ/EryC1/StrS family aminotransferase [Planctomycetota bacterium]